MKKRFAVAFLVGLSLILYPRAALGDQIVLFDALASSGTFGCGGDYTSPCDLNGFYKVSIQFTCPGGGCINEIKLWQRNNPGDNYAVVLDLFNTGPNDLGYSNIGYGQIYVEVIWAAGALRGSLIRLK